MKFKKTISFILILILLGGFSRFINIYAAKYLDSRYPRENGVIVGTKGVYIEKGDEAVLLLHGLTANPHSVKEIGIFLAEKGYTVYAPVIKGHGTSVFDLEKTNYLDWKKSAEDAYYFLAKNHTKIYIVGASLGGLLALDIASENKVNGIVIINAPIEVKSDLIELLPLVYLVSPYSIRGLFTLEELPVATELKLYDTLPLKSIAQLLSYIEHVKPKLKNVNSNKKEILLLKSSTHVNIISEEKELLKQRSLRFIKEVQ